MTLQKRRFCVAKEPLLPCKTYAFGTQNNWFCKALIIKKLHNRCFYTGFLRYCPIFSCPFNNIRCCVSNVSEQRYFSLYNACARSLRTGFYSH
ncbi:hypothetical protein BWX40_03800 [Prevotella intermedia]|nr:hypothetical protein BWX40_03800 [Prevotella intermedia]